MRAGSGQLPSSMFDCAGGGGEQSICDRAASEEIPGREQSRAHGPGRRGSLAGGSLRVSMPTGRASAPAPPSFLRRFATGVIATFLGSSRHR